MRTFAGVLLGVVVLLAGCERLVDLDRTVVASVNGEAIRLGDVVQRISQTPPQERLQANTAKGRERILDDLINERLLLSAADAAGITVTEDEVTEALEREQRELQQAQATAGGESIPVTRDRETVARNLRMEKVLADVIGQEALEARYEAMREGPPRDTVQYDFVLVRARNPNLAMDAETAFREGTTAAELAQTLRSHPDFLNGGRTAPVYTRLLAPWLQRELAANPRPGAVLRPYQDDTSGEQAIMVVRVINRWRFPPLGAIYESLVDELYQEYLDKLRAESTIERYPDRLALIERR